MSQNFYYRRIQHNYIYIHTHAQIIYTHIYIYTHIIRNNKKNILFVLKYTSTEKIIVMIVNKKRKRTIMKIWFFFTKKCFKCRKLLKLKNLINK